MTQRLQRVPLHLDAGETKSLSMVDIRAILRAADGLIGVGGRALLAKILRGSRSKDVLSRGLEHNPAYGIYQDLPGQEVMGRIDWTILHGYLHIFHDGRLPLLEYTPAGWKIECETYADEIIEGFDTLLASAQRPYPVSFLKDMNRELIMLALEKIQASADRKYLPLLEDWGRVDHKKVVQKISAVLRYLEGRTASPAQPS
ncbi:MAG: RQC-minor-1 family DNA-binding protein [Pseudomonadota bacterium]